MRIDLAEHDPEQRLAVAGDSFTAGRHLVKSRECGWWVSSIQVYCMFVAARGLLRVGMRRKKLRNAQNHRENGPKLVAGGVCVFGRKKLHFLGGGGSARRQAAQALFASAVVAMAAGCSAGTLLKKACKSSRQAPDTRQQSAMLNVGQCQSCT
jgi:hypothetical protein